MVVSAAGLALILYHHGVWWWCAPLGVVALGLAHAAVFAGGAWAARRWVGRRARGGPLRARPSHQSAGHLIHRPRLYDWQMRLHTFGRDRRLRQWTLDLADLRAGDAVLDVGCGTGALLLSAAQRVGPSGALHGVEPSAEMAAWAQKKAEALRIPLQITGGSAASLPHPPASIDAVFCTLALHHVPKHLREAALREMRRVLRPGGRVVIVDWQRPRSWLKAVTEVVSLVALLHHFGPSASPWDVLDIEPLLPALGFDAVTRHAFGGGAVGAVVGRLESAR
ncbi:MAG: methyltransferase domain-containing protein [Armatimonadetes bacterium]|nr:methyltransferase domain-containing protein [Armatimonadota bacterium]